MRSAGAGRAIPLLRLFTLSNIAERLVLVIFKVILEATIAFIHSRKHIHRIFLRLEAYGQYLKKKL